jgi:hypothetical protein
MIFVAFLLRARESIGTALSIPGAGLEEVGANVIIQWHPTGRQFIYTVGILSPCPIQNDFWIFEIIRA